MHRIDKRCEVCRCIVPDLRERAVVAPELFELLQHNVVVSAAHANTPNTIPYPGEPAMKQSYRLCSVLPARVT